MSAYVIFQIKINNKNNYKKYIKLAPPIVEKYGGEYLVRGGNSKILLGNWMHPRIVVVKFKNYETAMKWYNSNEYEPIKKIREDNSDANCIIVDGV